MRSAKQDFFVSCYDDSDMLGQKLACGAAQSFLSGQDTARLLQVLDAGAGLKSLYAHRPVLEWTVTWGHRPLFDCVVAKAGPDVINAQNEDGGWTALMRAVWARSGDHYTDTLLAKGADPRIVATDGRISAITIAQDAGLGETAEKLKAAAAALDARDAAGKRPRAKASPAAR